MVAHQYFESAEPPPYPPPQAGEGNLSATPPKRFRRGLLVAVAAVALATGAGSGAAAAALIDHSAPTRSASSIPTTTSTATSATSTPSSTAATIYKQDSPGVVTITVTLRGGQAIGSGIVVDTSGDIVTNAHVIAGAQRIEVTFSDGTTVTGTLVGSNSGADLAVIKVSVAASSLHPLTLGDSGTVQVGDNVYAIGSPFGLSGSLTEGIVSNLGQTGNVSTGSNVSGLIQTDAAINPGNSGGPLVNAQGHVIGINNSIESPVDGNVGVGFAIPINQVKQILPSLEGGSNV